MLSENPNPSHDCSPDCDVDIILSDVLPEVQFGVGLRHSNHTLNVTDRDGNATRGHALPSQLRVQGCYLKEGEMKMITAGDEGS